MELLKRDVEQSDDPIGIETFEGTIYLTVEDDALCIRFAFSPLLQVLLGRMVD